MFVAFERGDSGSGFCLAFRSVDPSRHLIMLAAPAEAEFHRDESFDHDGIDPRRIQRQFADGFLGTGGRLGSAYRPQFSSSRRLVARCPVLFSFEPLFRRRTACLPPMIAPIYYCDFLEPE
jgi:hypothetical protein